MDWGTLIFDAVIVIVAAVFGYLRGKLTAEMRIQVLQWMRVVEKVLSGESNETLHEAVKILIKHAGTSLTQYAGEKLDEMIKREAEQMQWMKKLARVVFKR